MSAGSDNSGPPPHDDVREVLRQLGEEPPAGQQEFSAGLHRRLVAAGAPPAGWLGRLGAVWQDLWRDRPQPRTLLTGAVLGALVTAIALTLLAGPREQQEAAAVPAPARSNGDCAENVAATPVVPAGTTEHHGHALGDRRPTRDRMGPFIGAERPERAHPPKKH